MNNRQWVPFKDEVIIEKLMTTKKTSPEEAVKAWYTSRTRDYVASHNLTRASVGKCLWELDLEMQNSSMWMREPFEE